MQIKKITENVWQINTGIGTTSNIYLIKKPELALVDLGNRVNIDLTIKALDLLKYKPEDIKKIIFTHLHYDHIGEPSKFKNAKFYASKDEIISFKFSPKKTTLKNWEEINKIQLIVLKDKIDNLKVIQTPGHTRGSICLFDEKERILFSGDTLFQGGGIGRTDLPTSMPKKMKESLLKLANIEYDHLCPGH